MEINRRHYFRSSPRSFCDTALFVFILSVSVSQLQWWWRQRTKNGEIFSYYFKKLPRFQTDNFVICIYRWPHSSRLKQIEVVWQFLWSKRINYRLWKLIFYLQSPLWNWHAISVQVHLVISNNKIGFVEFIRFGDIKDLKKPFDGMIFCVTINSKFITC